MEAIATAVRGSLQVLVLGRSLCITWSGFNTLLFSGRSSCYTSWFTGVELHCAIDHCKIYLQDPVVYQKAPWFVKFSFNICYTKCLQNILWVIFFLVFLMPSTSWTDLSWSISWGHMPDHNMLIVTCSSKSPFTMCWRSVWFMNTKRLSPICVKIKVLCIVCGHCCWQSKHERFQLSTDAVKS